jgi:hypothetical protein
MQITEEVPPTDIQRTNGGVQVRVKVLRNPVRDRLAARNAASMLAPDIERKMASLAEGMGREEMGAAMRGLVRSARALEEMAKGTPIAGAAARATAAVGHVQEALALRDEAGVHKAIEELKNTIPAALDEIRKTAAKLGEGA